MKKINFILLFIIIFGCEKVKRNEEVKNKIATRIDTLIFSKTNIKELHYWNNGELDSVSKFRKNKYIGSGKVKDNYIVFVLKKGNIKQYEGFLKDGRLDGVVYYYNSKGELSGVFNYLKGVKNGIAMILNDSLKTPRVIGNYVDGDMKDGFVLKFNESGIPNYLLENGNKKNSHLQTLEFYDSGTLKEINSKNNNRILDGWSMKFDIGGNIKIKTLYSNGEIVKEKIINKTEVDN